MRSAIKLQYSAPFCSVPGKNDVQMRSIAFFGSSQGAYRKNKSQQDGRNSGSGYTCTSGHPRSFFGCLHPPIPYPDIEQRVVVHLFALLKLHAGTSGLVAENPRATVERSRSGLLEVFEILLDAGGSPQLPRDRPQSFLKASGQARSSCR